MKISRRMNTKTNWCKPYSQFGTIKRRQSLSFARTQWLRTPLCLSRIWTTSMQTLVTSTCSRAIATKCSGLLRTNPMSLNYMSGKNLIPSRLTVLRKNAGFTSTWCTGTIAPEMNLFWTQYLISSKTAKATGFASLLISNSKINCLLYTSMTLRKTD